jgi:hypothetical protein
MGGKSKGPPEREERRKEKRLFFDTSEATILLKTKDRVFEKGKNELIFKRQLAPKCTPKSRFLQIRDLVCAWPGPHYGGATSYIPQARESTPSCWRQCLSRRIREIAEALGLSELIDRAEFIDAPNDAAAAAVRLVRAEGGEILLKGHLRTDELLRTLLHKEDGLRTGRLLSDVMLFQYGNGERRLVGLTDGGLNVAPNLEQKVQIVENAIEVMRSLGIAQPRIAIMSVTEVVSDALPSTIDAQALTAMGAEGAFGGAEVYGPLAVDNALLESAAVAKGIHHPVAGHADCLVAPNIEAANMFGKAPKCLGGSLLLHQLDPAVFRPAFFSLVRRHRGVRACAVGPQPG